MDGERPGPESVVAGDALPLPAPGKRWSLFLDFDGTLADLAETPYAVRRPFPQLTPVTKHGSITAEC